MSHPAILQGGIIPARAANFFTYVQGICISNQNQRIKWGSTAGKIQQKHATNKPMEKERLRTITIFSLKKIVIHKKRTITTKNENNETEEKKRKCNSFIIKMYKKVDSFNTKK